MFKVTQQGAATGAKCAIYDCPVVCVAVFHTAVDHIRDSADGWRCGSSLKGRSEYDELVYCISRESQNV